MHAIALTGLKFSGKGTTAKVAAEEFGYRVYRTRDQILADAADYGITKPSKDISIPEMQFIGNEGRKRGGNGYWAERLYESAQARGVEWFMMDGVRHVAEIDALARKTRATGSSFAVIGVEAWFMTRLGRVPLRNDEGDAQLRDVGDVDGTEALRRAVEKFSRMDDRDRGIGEPWHGQQVDACMAYARGAADTTAEYGYCDMDGGNCHGYLLRNDSTLEDYTASVRHALTEFAAIVAHVPQV